MYYYWPNHILGSNQYGILLLIKAIKYSNHIESVKLSGVYNMLQ